MNEDSITYELCHQIRIIITHTCRKTIIAPPPLLFFFNFIYPNVNRIGSHDMNGKEMTTVVFQKTLYLNFVHDCGYIDTRLGKSKDA